MISNAVHVMFRFQRHSFFSVCAITIVIVIRWLSTCSTYIWETTSAKAILYPLDLFFFFSCFFSFLFFSFFLGLFFLSFFFLSFGFDWSDFVFDAGSKPSSSNSSDASKKESLLSEDASSSSKAVDGLEGAEARTDDEEAACGGGSVSNSFLFLGVPALGDARLRFTDGFSFWSSWVGASIPALPFNWTWMWPYKCSNICNTQTANKHLKRYSIEIKHNGPMNFVLVTLQSSLLFVDLSKCLHHRCYNGVLVWFPFSRILSETITDNWQLICGVKTYITTWSKNSNKTQFSLNNPTTYW